MFPKRFEKHTSPELEFYLCPESIPAPKKRCNVGIHCSTTKAASYSIESCLYTLEKNCSKCLIFVFSNRSEIAISVRNSEFSVRWTSWLTDEENGPAEPAPGRCTICATVDKLYFPKIVIFIDKKASFFFRTVSIFRTKCTISNSLKNNDRNQISGFQTLLSVHLNSVDQGVVFVSR